MTSSRCVLAIDQGTTGSTCLMVRQDGAVVGQGYREITQHFPSPGEVEHDAEEIFERTREAAREAVGQAGVLPEVIGITNQRETIVLWDRATGIPVQRAIVWQDRRTARRCAELSERADLIAQRTGLVLDPYFSATKLEWMLAQPGVRERATRGELLAGTIDTWLIWKLTGGQVHATDFTNASRTMLLDIDARAWHAELLSLFGIPRSILPDVRASSASFGVTDVAFLGKAIPIGGVAGDQQAALFGQGGWHAGGCKNTYGTGAFLLLNTGAIRPEGGGGLLTTIACDATGHPCYALEASIFVAGAAVQWLRDGLGIISEAAATESLAASLRSNDGVYFVPALTGLGAPDWEPEARGTIVGLTRGTTRAHLARAALEAMAYSTADVVRALEQQGRVRLELLRVDGGAASNNWLMQFQSDLLRVPIERPDNVQSTAFGAAGLAGLWAGVWRSAEDFIEARHFTRFEPDPQSQASLAHAGWRSAVDATLNYARNPARIRLHE